MGFKFNPITATLDLVGATTSISGPGSSTDKAIVRWNGTSGTIIQDSAAFVQDGGAVQAQGFVAQKLISGAVVLPQATYMISSGIMITNTGSLQISQDSEVILV